MSIRTATRFSLTSTFEIIARRACFLLLVLALAACNTAEKTATAAYAYQVTDTWIPSRGVSIPVSYVTPISTSSETFPLVVMAHGHGGTRHENGAFEKVAARLAEGGIASIRMDFPGCGDSTEPFSENNLSNMLVDILVSRDFAIAKPGIDKHRVGLFGWSMGGRLVLLLGDRSEHFRAIATWTPAAIDGAGSMVSFLGGETEYQDYRKRAAEEGSVPFTTQWGQDQQLGLRWFIDLESSKPLKAASKFEGPLLVLYGDQDDVVPPAVSEAVINAAVNSSNVVRRVIAGADHGLGIYSGDEALTEEVIEVTVRFLTNNL